MSTQPRTPAGAPGSTGGQFAETSRGEADVELDANPARDDLTALLTGQLGRPLGPDETVIVAALTDDEESGWAVDIMGRYNGDADDLVELARIVRDGITGTGDDYAAHAYIERAVDTEGDVFGLNLFVEIPGTQRSLSELLHNHQLGGDGNPQCDALEDLVGVHRRLKSLAVDATILGSSGSLVSAS